MGAAQAARRPGASIDMPTPQMQGRARLLAVIFCALLSGGACANDRPFQEARTAVLEDEEDIWSIDTWAQRFGKVRALSIEPEYTFGDGNSVQVELTRLSDRAGAQTGHQAEVEFKHLFNNVARDGWAWGVSGALGTARTQGEGKVQALTFRLPLTVAFGDSGGLVHLNPGWEKASGVRQSWLAAVGVEQEIARRTVLFAELSRGREQQFGQLGVRYWLRKERVALDFSLQHFRGADGERASGFIFGISLYDL